MRYKFMTIIKSITTLVKSYEYLTVKYDLDLKMYSSKYAAS